MSCPDIVSWVLENASVSVRALAWMFQEILTDRCEVLPAESLFLLQFFLSMCESTSLLLELVLTLKALQPEPTQFGLDLALPSALLPGVPLRCWSLDGRRVLVFEGWLLNHTLAWALDNVVEGKATALFLVGIDVASLR